VVVRRNGGTMEKNEEGLLFMRKRSMRPKK
jgi:hypothetical protein